MESEMKLRSILKKPQQTHTTTATREETAPSESKPDAVDNRTALLESKPAFDNLIIEEKVPNGEYKVSEDADGRRMIKYVPKPRIRKTQMRVIKKRNNNISDGDLLLKYWTFIQRQNNEYAPASDLKCNSNE